MTTQNNPAPKGRKPLNFDYNSNLQQAQKLVQPAAMVLADQLAKVERYQAFIEESGLSIQYFEWETRQLNGDAAEA